MFRQNSQRYRIDKRHAASRSRRPSIRSVIGSLVHSMMMMMMNAWEIKNCDAVNLNCCVCCSNQRSDSRYETMTWMIVSVIVCCYCLVVAVVATAAHDDDDDAYCLHGSLDPTLHPDLHLHPCPMRSKLDEHNRFGLDLPTHDDRWDTGGSDSPPMGSVTNRNPFLQLMTILLTVSRCCRL